MGIQRTVEPLPVWFELKEALEAIAVRGMCFRLWWITYVTAGIYVDFPMWYMIHFNDPSLAVFELLTKLFDGLIAAIVGAAVGAGFGWITASSRTRLLLLFVFGYVAAQGLELWAQTVFSNQPLIYMDYEPYLLLATAVVGIGVGRWLSVGSRWEAERA